MSDRLGKWLVVAGAAGLAPPWVPGAIFLSADVKWQVLSGVSGAITGLFSAALWAHAAGRRDDQDSNSTAAGFSGATALFSAAAVNLPPTADIRPWIRDYWPSGAYWLGIVIVTIVFFWTIARWRRFGIGPGQSARSTASSVVTGG